MNRSQWIGRTIWGAGIVLILCVNVLGAIPRIYKGVQHPAGTDVVAVYESQGEELAPLVPVQTWASGQDGSLDTGKRVQVFIKNTYKDNAITYYPRATLMIAAAVAILQSLCWLVRRWTSRP